MKSATNSLTSFASLEPQMSTKVHTADTISGSQCHMSNSPEVFSSFFSGWMISLMSNLLCSAWRLQEQNK